MYILAYDFIRKVYYNIHFIYWDMEITYNIIIVIWVFGA